MTNLFFKGYFADIDISISDNLFYGKLSGINDLVSFEGKTAIELQAAFERAVDDYIETCNDLKKEQTTYCHCGVPNQLHNTCCGWDNANLIIYPSNKLEIEWQRKKLEATNGRIIIDKKCNIYYSSA